MQSRNSGRGAAPVGSSLPILIAGLGGGAVALATVELLSSVPFVRQYLASAASAIARTRREGRFPTVVERRRLGVLSGVALGVLTLTVTGPRPAALIAGFGPGSQAA